MSSLNEASLTHSPLPAPRQLHDFFLSVPFALALITSSPELCAVCLRLPEKHCVCSFKNFRLITPQVSCNGTIPVSRNRGVDNLVVVPQSQPSYAVPSGKE